VLKKLLTSVVVCSAVALVFPSSASAVTVCDNFGREWDLAFSACPDAPGGMCVSGSRDIFNELGCGPFPVYGTFVKNVFSVTTLDDAVDACVSVSWRGPYNGINVTGTWENEGPSTGAFTLAPCAPGPPDANNEKIDEDPQVSR